MGRMGPGHTLMAKCSCMEIFTGEAGGMEVAWGAAEGEEADEAGLEVEEGGMAKWVVEGGGGGFETLMWTVKVDCGGGGGESRGGGGQHCSRLVSVGSVLKFTAQNKNVLQETSLDAILTPQKPK